MSGAWRRPQRTWWTTSSRQYRCANGCCRCRSPLGGEWRADLQVGSDGLFFTEFYQPLLASQFLFVAPRFEILRGLADNYGGANGDNLSARDNVSVNTVGIDLGNQFTKYGDLRVGLLAGKGETDLQTGTPVQARYGIERDIGAVCTRRYLDQLHNVAFPRSGFVFDGRVLSHMTQLGASNR